MWKTLVENSALILGLALSIHTAYRIFHDYRAEHRLKRALLGDLQIRLGFAVELSTILAGKAARLTEKQAAGDGAQDLAAILARIDHFLESSPAWDMEKIGPMLTVNQIGTFLEFRRGYELYCVRLKLRFMEYREAPNRPGAVERLLASAALLTEENLQGKYQAFEKAVGRHG